MRRHHGVLESILDNYRQCSNPCLSESVRVSASPATVERVAVDCFDWPEFGRSWKELAVDRSMRRRAEDRTDCGNDTFLGLPPFSPLPAEAYKRSAAVQTNPGHSSRATRDCHPIRPRLVDASRSRPQPAPPEQMTQSSTNRLPQSPFLAVKGQLALV